MGHGTVICGRTVGKLHILEQGTLRVGLLPLEGPFSYRRNHLNQLRERYQEWFRTLALPAAHRFLKQTLHSASERKVI